MKKIVRLTESDLVRLVERIIKENDEIGSEASKVESIIEKPKFENFFENVVSSLSPEEKENLSDMLDNLGITANSDLNDVHSEIESRISDSDSTMEMTEDDDNENPHKTTRQKVANVLNDLGAFNVQAWGGVPAAIAIGSMTGMPMGFAISWGVTGLLIGLAKALDKTGKL